MKLKNYSSIITGVSPESGIGYAIAKDFAREGSNLVLAYRSADPEKMQEFAHMLKDQYKIEVVLVKGDVTDPDFAKALSNQAISNFGKIDCLVNSAGIAHQALLVDLEKEDWDRTIATDLTSVYLICKAVLPNMIKNHFGRIINIASQNGQKGAVECCHYAAAKGGVIAFTKSLAKEVGAYGITVNCIAPGPIETKMLSGTKPDWVKKKREELIIPRFGLVEEVSPSAVLLAAVPDGNIFTGQTLGPNCGDVML